MKNDLAKKQQYWCSIYLLNYYRKDILNISQQELARRLKQTQSYVSKSSSYKLKLDLIEAYNFCKALNVTLYRYSSGLELILQQKNLGEYPEMKAETLKTNDGLLSQTADEVLAFVSKYFNPSISLISKGAYTDASYDQDLSRLEYTVLQKFLAYLRKYSGIGQAELANRLGETQSFISKCERGQRKLDIIEVRAICRAIGVNWPKSVEALEKCLKDSHTLFEHKLERSLGRA